MNYNWLLEDLWGEECLFIQLILLWMFLLQICLDPRNLLFTFLSYFISEMEWGERSLFFITDSWIASYDSSWLSRWISYQKQKIMLKDLWSPVQFSCSFVSDSATPWTAAHLACLLVQHTSTPTPGVYSDLWPLSWWYHLTISSSVIPFSCLQSFPASGSFPMSLFFASGSQSVGVSASASEKAMVMNFLSEIKVEGSFKKIIDHNQDLSPNRFYFQPKTHTHTHTICSGRVFRGLHEPHWARSLSCPARCPSQPSAPLSQHHSLVVRVQGASLACALPIVLNSASLVQLQNLTCYSQKKKKKN